MKMYIVKKSEYRPLEGKRIGLQSIGGNKNPTQKQQRVTTAMVLNKLIEFIEKQNEFNEEQRKHNTNVDYRLDEQANLLNKVIKLNNLKTE